MMTGADIANDIRLQTTPHVELMAQIPEQKASTAVAVRSSTQVNEQ